MEKLQEITQRYSQSYKVIKDILLDPSNEIKYNDETNVQDAPFFMIKSKDNIFDIMGNIQLIKDKENYSLMLDNSSINFSLDHKMFYYIFKTADVQVIIKDFTFFSLSTINNDKDKYEYFIDIALSYIGMGHVYVISMLKDTGKLFLRHGGGSNGYEAKFNYEKFLHFKPLPENLDKIFDFSQVIKIVIERSNKQDKEPLFLYKDLIINP